MKKWQKNTMIITKNYQIHYLAIKKLISEEKNRKQENLQRMDI